MGRVFKMTEKKQIKSLPKIEKEPCFNVPIKSWCKNIEEGAYKQAINLANHPVIFRHVALMPDCHQGYGMPIGGVIACKNAIIPNAVGVDIGCGMRAVRTSLAFISVDSIKTIMGLIREKVPVGFKHHDKAQENDLIMPGTMYPIMRQEEGHIDYQLGTLGGGNHFIEIQKGNDGYVWFMIHSGSRNFGKKVCDYYNKIAKNLNSKWHSKVEESWDLAFLPIGSMEAKEYIEEMRFALNFAKENRRLISVQVELAFFQITKCCFDKGLDIHHNYASHENHFKQNVWIHRKGATSARQGQLGIIPGSMGTPSYIVKGLGNAESFMSCSHGAGRKMGRRAASRQLTVVDCNKAMDGIVFGRWGTDRKGNIDLGEAPQAYKNIDEVIEAELDLIKPLIKLMPLGVIKG